MRLALLGVLVGCNPETPSAPTYLLSVRTPVAGTLVVEDRAIPIGGERFEGIGGLGPPPYTVTFIDDTTLVTVVDVPGDTLDLMRLLDGPDSRPGNLVRLPLRAEGPGEVALIGIVDGRILRARDGFIELPRGTPADLWGLWSRDGVPSGLGFRRINDPEAWLDGLELRPAIALDAQIDVQLPRPPSGWVQVELTIDGLRTGLVLGGGVAGPDSAVRVRRPQADAIPGGGLWVAARSTDLDLAVHVPLDTEGAGLDWPGDPAITPRPGAIDAGAVIARDRPRLRWEAGPGLLRADLELTDGCARARWQVIAPAEPGALDLPLPPRSDPLDRPLLTGSTRIDEIVGIGYGARLSGELGRPAELPIHTNRRRVRGSSGAWRAGPATCDPSPAQGSWYAHERDSTCDPGAPAQTIIVDRCGAVIPLPEDPALCGEIVDDTVALRAGGRLALSPDGDGWRFGDRVRLRAPLAPATPAPPELLGRWFQVSMSEQPYEAGPDGPGVASGSERILEVGEPSAGPWAEIDAEGRVTVTLDRHPLAAILTRYDGASARLIIDGRACPEAPPHAVARDEDGTLVIEEWVPSEGLVRRWRLSRRART